MKGLGSFAALLALFLPAIAAAHAPSFAAARWRRDGGHAELELRITGSRTDGLALRPVFPEGCSIERTQVVQEGEILVRLWDLACEGELDRPLGFDRLDRVQVHFRTDELSAVLNQAQPTLQNDEEAAASPLLHYLRLGLEHIAGGFDHLLFVLGLLLLVRGAAPQGRTRRIITVVSAFTLGHSVTLAAAALGFVSINARWVEAIIAGSLVLLAVEITSRDETLIKRRPAALATAFGLVHGLGFAGALGDVGLPTGDRVQALLGFNLGVEVGQLAFVGLAAGILALLTRYAISQNSESADGPPQQLRALHTPLAYVIGVGGAFAFFQQLILSR